MDLKDFKRLELSHFDNVKSVEFLNNEVDQLIYVDDSALKVFRDFKEHKALTVRGDVNIKDVKAKIVNDHKDFILVTNAKNEVIGSIALQYILGHALQERASSLGVKPVDLSANDAKISLANINCISYDIIKDSKVGHILNTLINSDRHHIVVYDEASDGQKIIRGYFSLAYIRRKLGIDLTHSDYSMNTLKKDL